MLSGCATRQAQTSLVTTANGVTVTATGRDADRLVREVNALNTVNNAVDHGQPAWLYMDDEVTDLTVGADQTVLPYGTVPIPNNGTAPSDLILGPNGLVYATAQPNVLPPVVQPATTVCPTHIPKEHQTRDQRLACVEHNQVRIAGSVLSLEQQ